MPKSFLRGGWGKLSVLRAKRATKAIHVFVIAAVLLTHVQPAQSYAWPPGSPNEQEVPALPVAFPIPAMPAMPILLTDDDSADEVAETLGKQVREIQRGFGNPSDVQWQVRVRFVHARGERDDDRIRRISSILTRQGIPVAGDILDRSEFAAMTDRLEASTETDPNHPIRLLVEKGAIPKQEFWRAVRRSVEKTFGLARGWTYFKLNVQRVVLGRVDNRIEFADLPPGVKSILPTNEGKIADHILALNCAFWAMYFLTRTLHPETTSLYPYKPIGEWGVGMPSAVLFCWVYLYQVFFPYIMMVRQHGISPRWSEDEPPGEQLKADKHSAHSRHLFFLVTLGPELLINMILFLLIMGGSGIAKMDDVAGIAWSILRNALLATFAIQPIDTLAGFFRDQSEVKKHAGKRGWAGLFLGIDWTIRQVWWNWIYPPIKSFDLMMKESWIGGVYFLLVGGLGMIIDGIRTGGWTRGRQLPTSEQGKSQPLKCSDLIEIEMLARQLTKRNAA